MNGEGKRGKGAGLSKNLLNLGEKKVLGRGFATRVRGGV